MWTYSQQTGQLRHDGQLIAAGYSGRLNGRNNPAAQAIPDVGPVPQGSYTIQPAIHHPRLGPCAMPLSPNPGTDDLGRAGFYIHGDNSAHDASHGCIILGPAIRQQISQSSDRQLTVIE